MRIPGIDKSKPNVEVCLLMRNDIDDVAIECTAVISYDRFDKLVKEPVLQEAKFPDGTKKPTDETRAQFNKEVLEYYDMRHGFMLFETLKSNNFEWENVSENDPKSWLNCAKEIDNLPLTDAEQNRLIAAVHRANGMSDALIEEAEKCFLQKRAHAKILKGKKSIAT